jgi:uncharacterized surface protein with fasciclin (FAS1) repeats
MRKTQKFIALAAVASLGVFATACGSDSDDAATDEAATEEVTEESVAEEVMTEDTAAATEEEAGADAPQTIVDIAAGNPDFSTLVALVTAAGLGETLAGEGPFTVLAPTNAGFEALAEKMGVTIEELSATLTGDVELLKTVLTSHVIAGKVLAADTAAAKVELHSGVEQLGAFDVLSIYDGDLGGDPCLAFRAAAAKES